MKLACIADDFTGATDLAGELAKAGLQTAIAIGADGGAPDSATEAVVMALKTRSVPVEDAVDQTLKALDAFRARGFEHVFFKYCSTFDSTADGNIGPVLEALGRELGVPLALACPAFPANRRTVYQGHLFVGDRLLNASGMEHHPLNPMTDANLVSVLQRQCQRKVGLISHADIAQGNVAGRVAALAEEGCATAIADAVDEASLDTLAEWCVSQRLSSGASGLGAAVGRRLSGRKPAHPAVLPALSGRRAIIAGSCSTATLEQIARARHKMPSLRIAPGPDVLEKVAQWVAIQPPEQPVLIYASASADELAEQRALGQAANGSTVELMLADLAAMLSLDGASALIVAGGETSGAVLQRLHIARLDVGPEIAPGVPWTGARLSGGRQIALALKSGNFGGPDFFIDAWKLLQ